MKIKPVLLAIASISFAAQAYAENKAEILELGTIDVVSTTPLQALGTPISEVPANVQVGTSKQIDQQKPLNLGEFLDNNLGSVNTSNAVGNPYQMDVSYRGFNATPILGAPVGMSVYLDGVRFNEPFGDIVNWDLIPANAISNINLIPGSNPLFGLNTLGGALAVNTKSGASFPGAKATLSGGSWGRAAFEAEAGGEDKEHGLDYYVAGNVFHEDGWRDHSSSDVRQFFSKVGWHNDKTDLDLSLALADNEMEGTQALPLSMWGGWNDAKKAYTYPDSIKNKLAMISLKGTHFLADDKLIAGNIYYRMSNSKSFNSNAECDGLGLVAGCSGDSNNGTPDNIDALNVTSKTNQDGYGGSMQMSFLNDLAGRHNNFTVGASADWSRVTFRQNMYAADLVNFQTVTNDEGLQDYTRLKTRSDYYGLYATDNFYFNDQLNLTLSGRYNIAKVDLKGGTLDDSSILTGDHEFKRFNPAVGLNYNPTKTLGFYGSYNEGMRAPTPIELSCADPDHPCSLPTGFNSDPALKKVVAKTWEGGVRGKLVEDINWNFGFYKTKTDNDIQFIFASPTQGYFQNVGQTEHKGLEIGLNGKVDKFNFAANYGFVKATYQSDFSVISIADGGEGSQTVSKGDKIPGIARQTFKLRTSYEVTPAWSIGSNLIAAASQYAHGAESNHSFTADELDQDSGVKAKVPGYVVLNLDTSYKLNPNWVLFAKVNNVFDKEYSTFGQLEQNIYTGVFEQFRTPSAPRAGWIGITYQFGQTPQAGSVDRD